MRELTDFVNHGILPFVGRNDLIERILTFWIETIHRGGLEALLIEAPAGRGKTRLVEELASPIRRRGGLLLRVRLYPETSTSLMSGLEHQITLAESRLQLSEGPSEIFSRLRRLVRLRPTLLALEDLHLLEEDAVGEISRLFDALEDEPIASLLPGRPLPEPIRNAIEPFLVRTEELRGLDNGDLKDLWSSLFGTSPQKEIIDILQKRTRGNPLALRSGLRGLIERGMLRDTGERWEMTCSLEEYDKSLHHHVRRLLKGITSSLSPEEYEATLLLARLGEIFSREAAAALLAGKDQMIEQLIFRGIVRQSDTFSTPLNGVRSGSTPLHFTHTLLHEHCHSQPVENPQTLLAPLLTESAHYSYSYFRVLLELLDTIAMTREEVESVIVSLRETINGSSHHPGWRNLSDVHHLMERVIAYGIDRGYWNDEERSFYRGLSEIMWTVAFNRKWRGAEHAERSRKLVEICRNPQSDRMARMRLRSLSQMIGVTQYESDDAGTIAIDAEVESLLADYPALEIDDQYFFYLGRILQRAPHLTQLCQRVLLRYEAISKRVDELDEYRHLRLKLFSAHMIPIFRNREEFGDRLRLLESLENDPDVPDYLLNVYREQALLTGGLLEPLIRKIEATRLSITTFDDILGLHSIYWIERSTWLFLGVEEEKIDELLERPTEQGQNYDDLARWHRFNHQSLRLGVATILEETPLAEGNVARRFTDSCLIALEVENVSGNPYISEGNPLLPLQQMIRGEEEVATEQVRDNLLEFLRQEPVQVHVINVLLALLEWSAGRGEGDWKALDLEEELLGSIDRWVDWLVDAPAPGLIERLVSKVSGRIDRKRALHYKARLKEATSRAEEILFRRFREREEKREGESSPAGSNLRVIGEIEVFDGTGESTRVRGAGIKRALGVLISDRILKKPMEFAEIARLLSGDDVVDPERGRKTVNNAVYKLRKLLGQEAVTTERGEVRLNREVLDVDLLEMTDLVESAEKGTESGTVGQNLQDVQRVLELYGRGVIFPGLYDPFLEAVRSELEWRIRSLLITTSSLLRDQGDFGGAEDLLRRGVERMPGDEEILDALCEVLLASGKFIEAERIRMQSVA